MRSATIFASVLAFAASALAQAATPGYAVVAAPGNGEVVPSGKTYTIKWSAGKFSGPATISLMGGNDPTTLQVLNPITTGIEVKTESFAWAVPCSLGDQKTYGLKIADQATNGATFQYSFPFQIKGPSCGASSSSSASVSATSSVTVSASGYPTKGQSETTSSTKASSYPVQTSSSSSSSVVSTSSTISSIVSTSTIVSSSSAYHNSTTKSYTSHSISATTLATQSTPIVYITQTSAVGGSSSSAHATSTTPSLPTATGGASRAGAGLAFGLLAAALAL
ncbi:Ser-Thr-rich glycosyl-phosphatidyl-inositol-anchored membrane family-domain-containing protein [Xylaria flabelliformis]|nr:Ser-Thr-rich glycosyl-phosphatidyl-inositol-anchored membrane family-domain-containing protein [Xylaria flabelliformis]